MIRKTLIVSVLVVVLSITSASNADLVALNNLKSDMTLAFNGYITTKNFDDLKQGIEEAQDSYYSAVILAVAQCFSNIASVATSGVGGIVGGTGTATPQGFALFYAEESNINQVSLLIDSQNIVTMTSTVPSYPQLFYSEIHLSNIFKAGTHTITYQATDLQGVSYVPVKSTFEIVPVPGAFLLGSIGLSFSGWLCRRRQNKED